MRELLATGCANALHSRKHTPDESLRTAPRLDSSPATEFAAVLASGIREGTASLRQMDPPDRQGRRWRRVEQYWSVTE